MQSFENKIAVVTGGGTGMGRELVRLLAAEGCHVAMCDVNPETMEESRSIALATAPAGTRVTAFVADVSKEVDLEAFRDAVRAEHSTDHVHLVFNNAGIGGGGSMIVDDRAEWERVFNICWFGVYFGTRVFLPLLIAAPEGHLVNTSSINGFWATVGPNMAHSAYSSAKFAVKGFSEALINDFKLNAPHLKVSVVMPGHIGTPILTNSNKMLGRNPKELDEDQLAQIRERFSRASGMDLSGVSDEDIRTGMIAQEEGFRDLALTSAVRAAEIILDGVRNEQWRILVGDDAIALDAKVRADPENAYDPDFFPDIIRLQ